MPARKPEARMVGPETAAREGIDPSLTLEQHRLACENYRLAYGAARMFHRKYRNLEYADVRSICFEALFIAARTYDSALGKFRTHHYWVCRRELTRREPEGGILVSRQGGVRKFIRQSSRAVLFTMDTRHDDPHSVAMTREADAERAAAAKQIGEAISGLPERHAHVVRRCVMGEATLHEVGCELGITKERVRQIREAALSILRKRLRA